MSVTQRPVLEAALGEPAADPSLWRAAPSWFLFGELDQNIPAGAHRILAERAGSRRTVEIAGGSHAIGVSHAAETAEIILEGAKATLAAGQ